jgi:hypothetical protein
LRGNASKRNEILIEDDFVPFETTERLPKGRKNEIGTTVHQKTIPNESLS